MSFKLYSDQIMDMPLLVCDVCGERIVDLWKDKATSSPSKSGQTTDVTVHHEKCAATGVVSISLIDFLRLFIIQNRIGNVGSNGKMDKITVEYPTGKGFKK